MHLDRAQRVAYGALIAGDRKSIIRFEADVSGNCEVPVTVERYTRPSPKHRDDAGFDRFRASVEGIDENLPFFRRHRVARARSDAHMQTAIDEMAMRGAKVQTVKRVARRYRESKMFNFDGHDGRSPVPVWTIMQTRCRKCTKCCGWKARRWARLALAEVAQSVRTWFVTLTLSDTYLFVALSQTRDRLHSGGTDYDALSEADRFAELTATVGAEVTKYLKRVREQSGGPLRVILVAERGSEEHTARLHFHALIHECDREWPVRKEVLDAQWRKFGFTYCRLVRRETSEECARAAWYVCKYISKSSLARVRASLRYGTASGVAERAGPSGPTGALAET